MTYGEFETKCWPSLKEKLIALEPLRKQERKALMMGTVISIIVFGIIIYTALKLIPISGENSVKLVFGIPLIVSILIGASIYVRFKPKDYRKIYKKKIIDGLLTHTKYQWRHILFDPIPKENRVDIRKAFLASGLYFSGNDDDRLSFDADDIFYSDLHNILMAEVQALRESGDRRKRNRVVLFSGIFFRFDISHKFRGETYMRSEYRGVFSQAVGNTLTPRNRLRETDLEWNDFEKAISVQTTNEVEAREILTPDFMEILYEWWLSHKKATRLSFKDNYVYLALPSSKNLFEPKTFSKPEKHKKELWEYLDAVLLAERLFTHIEHKYRVVPITSK